MKYEEIMTAKSEENVRGGAIGRSEDPVGLSMVNKY